MISLSRAAGYHALDHMRKRGHGVGIRVGVKTTGCSGLMYVMEPVDEILPEDLRFSSQGVDVFVDPKSLVYIDGTKLDYVKQGLNEGFEFKNPNVSTACGCGKSFTTK